MFKITKGDALNTYNIYAYNFVKEANFHAFLYSARNLNEDDALFLIKGAMSKDNEEEAKWALDITRLTTCNAIIGEDGELKAVPVRILNRDCPIQPRHE